jgi:hypothetical protein
MSMPATVETLNTGNNNRINTEKVVSKKIGEVRPVMLTLGEIRGVSMKMKHINDC